ncbi:hypothetical protein QFZ50_003434 [Arthrobacter agilis]|nr:hypothetical protein [Arthrobacter agilis]
MTGRTDDPPEHCLRGLEKNKEVLPLSDSTPGAPAAGRPTYVIGVDYGTLSGRAVVVRVSDGAELGASTLEYPHAVMDATLAATGEQLPPEWALQVPSDYVDVLREAVPAAVRQAGVDPQDVIGIATDFTACTMVPTLADGTPLNEVPGYEGRPHAYVKLWKHHAAQGQANRINALAAERGEAWLPRYGGLISSEWEFAKGLQLLEEDRELYDLMDHWVEAADWIVWQLTGQYVRNACTAGYKGIYQDGAYPSDDFLAALNPDFAGFAREKVEHTIGALASQAGTLSEEAAGWTGLPAGIAVAVGNVDAHVTGPGRPGHGSRPDGRHHGDLDMPRHELGPPQRGARHVRRRRRRDRRGLLRVRGRPVRRRRHLRVVRGPPGARRDPGRRDGPGPERARIPHRAGAGRARGSARPRGPRLALREPLRPRGPRALRHRRGPHPRHEAARGVPRTAGIDGVRDTEDRRDLQRLRRAGDRVRRPPAGSSGTRSSCRSTRTC